MQCGVLECGPFLGGGLVDEKLLFIEMYITGLSLSLHSGSGNSRYSHESKNKKNKNYNNKKITAGPQLRRLVL